MRRKAVSVVLATPLAFSLYVLSAGCTSSSDAEADPASCGNIDVSAQASCTVEVDPIVCEGQCTPVSFYAECSGRCDASLSATCTGSCQGSCEGRCEADPGSFSCQADCQGQCEASCAGQCSGNECEGQCAATCEGECSASCEGTPPSATCEGKCQASCEGECHAEANFDCSLSCQAELQGGCELSCQSPDGALFCDGSYVDAGNNLAECIAYLNTILTVEVTADGSAACADNQCTAEGEASCSASVAPHPVSTGVGWLGAGLAALGLAVARRRRRG